MHVEYKIINIDFKEGLSELTLVIGIFLFNSPDFKDLIENQDETTKENLENMNFDELMDEKRKSDEFINKTFKDAETQQKLKDQNFFLNSEQRNLYEKKVIFI